MAMYDPRSGMGCLKMLVQGWAMMFALARRPTEPISDAWRLFLRIAAVAACALSVFAGWFFYQWTFHESDAWARFMMALFTFGLFGLPTSIVPVVIFGLLAHVHPALYGPAALGLTLAYFAQWLFLAWGIFQQSRAPRL